jgi:hypothetical protein
MTKWIGTFLYAACIFITNTSLAQSTNPLHELMPQFEVQNVSVPDAVVKAGKQAGVPLGIDASDPTLRNRNVSLKNSGVTLGEVLQQIMAAGPGLYDSSGWQDDRDQTHFTAK